MTSSSVNCPALTPNLLFSPYGCVLLTGRMDLTAELLYDQSGLRMTVTSEDFTISAATVRRVPNVLIVENTSITLGAGYFVRLSPIDKVMISMYVNCDTQTGYSCDGPDLIFNSS